MRKSIRYIAERWQNLALFILSYTAFSFLLPSDFEPLDTSPGLGRDVYIKANVVKDSLLFSVTDKERRRIVNFKDKDFDGDLDWVEITNSNRSQIYNSLSDLNSWKDTYLDVRNRYSDRVNSMDE